MESATTVLSGIEMGEELAQLWVAIDAAPA
jgi:hypothetical protein